MHFPEKESLTDSYEGKMTRVSSINKTYGSSAPRSTLVGQSE